MIRIDSPNQSRQHRLLGGWRDVYEEINSLCRTVAEIPDECACDNGDAHLNGRCPCCGNVAEYRVPACGTCDEQLERLRPVIDVLTADRSRFLPVVWDVLRHRNRDAAARIGAIDAQAMTFSASFERLLMAVGAFRSDCRLSHMRALKDAAGLLLAEAAELDRLVE
jgi:hypothetical protein